MARKKVKKMRDLPRMGWDATEVDESKVAEGLKRTEMDEGKVRLVDRDISTPYIHLGSW